MIREQQVQDKKYKATLKKLPFKGWKTQPQTIFQEFERLQRQQTNHLICLIKSNITHQNPLEIIYDCLTALSNALTTDKKQDFQRGAHFFIPHVFSLLRPNQDFSIVQMAIKYLIRLTSFGNLNEECVELFKQRGIQTIISLIKYGKAEHQYQLFGLVANLSIDNVILRDTLIHKDAIKAIINEQQIHSSKPVLKRRAQEFKLKALYALIAFGLGDPLPDKNWIEQGIKKVRNSIDYIISEKCPFSSQLVCGALWLLYHYSNYRDEKECILLLNNLLRMRSKYQNEKESTLGNPFNLIFKQIYEYYFQKEPEGNMMNILHGGCYKDSLGIQNPWKVYLQYTSKMYHQLFQVAVRHRIREIKGVLIKPWKYALSISIQQQIEPQHRICGIKFIFWVLGPLQMHCGGIHRQKLRQLGQYEQLFIKSQLLPEIQQYEIALSCLRHNNIKIVALIANRILKKYYQLSNNNQNYRFNIKIQ